MTYHAYRESNDVEFLVDLQSGADDPIYFSSPNHYERSIVRGSKAAIENCIDVWYKNGQGWYLVTHRRSLPWPAYSLEYEGQNDRRWMDSRGLQAEEASNILDMRLIKRIQGTSVDPTMFLKDLDTNFSTFTKRVNQAARFIENLKNPKELARLTLRYFKGSETRRSLTSRYAKARKGFLKRTANWKTRNWSDSYLEYQFGWKPMCNDVWNLLGLAREQKIRSAQQSARVGLQPQETAGSRPKAGPTGRASDIAYCRTSTAGHARLSFEITSPWLRKGASLESPAYSTWDSIPYSWLVDCVTNVGAHLKYIMYDAGLTLRSGYRSVLRTVTGHVDIDSTPMHQGDGVGWASDEYYSISAGSLSYEGVQCLRYVYHDFPAIPWFNKVLNTLENTELLSVIAAFVHQRIAGFMDFRRPWKTMSPKPY